MYEDAPELVVKYFEAIGMSVTRKSDRSDLFSLVSKQTAFGKRKSTSSGEKKAPLELDITIVQEPENKPSVKNLECKESEFVSNIA